jgi:hypothetical protein
MSDSDKPALYLETTVPSYYVARPSRDVVALAHQELTREWWERRASNFTIYISPLVLQEAAVGDAGAAARRLDVLAGFSVLRATEEIERLAQFYFEELCLPDRALRDAGHFAFACGYGMQYLLTWNCVHLANAEIQFRLIEVNERRGLKTPIVCTPEALMGFGEE